MEDKTANWGTEKISKILFRLAPPVMLAQLIQALYNIIDSFFVGRYSDAGLTALSIIYPMQLLMIAIAVGSGVGVNTIMAAKLGAGKKEEADGYAGVGTVLALFLWAVFALISWLIMPAYANMSTDSAQVAEEVIVYGRIVCVFSIGLFLESCWTKVLQADGNMKTPMAAQIAGAAVNILLDPILIFGFAGIPSTGIAGAAIATVAGQAVAALGLYYKWQTFFFIPLGAMQTCIVPVISYNFARKSIDRCRKTLFTSVCFGWILMAVGTLCFLLIPSQMLRVFTQDDRVIQIGRVGFRFVGVSFLPMVTSLIFPVFFQAVGAGLKSSLLTVVRTVVLFVPLGYLFSRFGLTWFWLTFPVTEVLTGLVGVFFYRRFLRGNYASGEKCGA